MLQVWPYPAILVFWPGASPKEGRSNCKIWDIDLIVLQGPRGGLLQF